jgi:phosphate:Na+ symporter
VFPLETAITVVLGAELGTTIKILIGAIRGTAAKKRVATANFIFNIVITLFGFLLLVPLVKFIRDIIGLHDPLFILVAFQSLINIAGAVIFYFFLGHIAGFLEKRFTSGEKEATYYLQDATPDAAASAIDLLEKEVALFIYRIFRLNMRVFKIKEPDNGNAVHKAFDAMEDASLSYEENYKLIKKAEGELLAFYSSMGEEKLEKQDFNSLSRLMSAVRNAMYSAKGMKDIDHNRKEFGNSANDTKFNTYELFRSQLKNFYEELYAIFFMENEEERSGRISQLWHKLKDNYEERIRDAYRQAGDGKLRKEDIATLFNLDRELYSSCNSIILAVRDYFPGGPDSVEIEDNSPADLEQPVQ